MKPILLGSVVLISVVLAGCEATGSTHSKWSGKSGDAIFTDASQRGVYRVSRKAETGNTVYEGFCAEPSPDAVAALAETLGLELSITDKGSLGFTNSTSESAASIGLRTAAIQTLRDVMYRNCEAYALGGVTAIGLETLQRRFQSTIVAILAIEQLTGAIRAPAASVVAGAGSGSAETIADLTKQTETARAALNQAKASAEKNASEYKDAKTKLDSSNKYLSDNKSGADAANAKDAAKRSAAEKELVAEYKKAEDGLATLVKAEADAKTTLESANLTVSERDAALKSIDAGRLAALVSGGSASGSSRIEALSVAAPLSDNAAKSVSEAVSNIVTSTIALGFTREVCTTLIGQSPNEPPFEGSPLSVCVDLLADNQLNVSPIVQ